MEICNKIYPKIYYLNYQFHVLFQKGRIEINLIFYRYLKVFFFTNSYKSSIIIITFIEYLF
jgi:hypothetical protein